jgi:hypothetical protein
MALSTASVAVSVVKQPTVDTFVDPTTAGLLPVSNLSMAIEGITIANDEVTGSIFRNADAISGKRITGSFNLKLRPPGGASPPAANAYLPGLFLQAAKFNEVITSAAIPASAEAGTSGTTTALTLGAGATGTLNLYKGMAISLASMGTSYRTRMTAISAYTAAKVATFCETFGSSITGNYQIPRQLQYVWDVSSADSTLLSLKIWLAGHRFDLMNVRVTGLQVVVPTSTKDQSLFPEIAINFSADMSTHTAEATPQPPVLGAVPFFKDADCWMNRVAIGTQTFTLDMGLQAENPPNPNKVDGSDAAELVGGNARVTMTRQKYLPAVIDPLALADAQTYLPFWAQWGNAAGAMTQIVVTDARANYSNPDLGGAFIMESGDLMIDPAAKCVQINFPY